MPMRKFRNVNFTLNTFYSTESCETLIELDCNLNSMYSQNYHKVSKTISDRISSLHDELIKLLCDMPAHIDESEYNEYQKKKKQELENSYCCFMEEHFSEIAYPEEILNKFVIYQNGNLWIEQRTKLFRFNADTLCAEDCEFNLKDYSFQWLEDRLKRDYDLEIFKIIPTYKESDTWQFLAIAEGESEKLHKINEWLEFIETDSEEICNYRPYINW